ncbi:tissue inhibitor of metalloproteinase [Drosophila mojavensis]|uniref:NTR domain-containing protein n=1 Tax=Drosophila mojavensis TaxID=7230 RepID=B4K5H9_DROMO|nr:tissue inhibitor of metalloproteinase [Drosophila mojavensis]EDW14016.1 uncharacterized protein Dmoj_GI24034 [Drosophila mojavensis]
MELTKHLSLLALALVAVLAFYGHSTDACVCELAHPQKHYCNADYVVQLRVLRKSETLQKYQTVYKVQIKRIYKATPEARRMLRDGRLSSPSSDSMCAIKLELGKIYIIAGRMPQLNLCSYYKEYINMTISERRGFSGAYGTACNCTINTCYKQQCPWQRESADSCSWSMHDKCKRDYSSCVLHKRQTPVGEVQYCRWRRTLLYKKCLSYP